MPIVEHAGLDFTQYDPLPTPDPEFSASDVWGAAWRLENDIQAMMDLATRPTFPATPDFGLATALKERGLWDDRNHFVGVGSQEELEYRASRLEQERKDRQVLERAGWAGVGAALTMGVLSPTMFIPLTAGGRGIKALGEGALLGLGAGAAQEIPLSMAQEERTLGESVIGVGSAAVVGGLLGGAAGLLAKSDLEKVIAQLERDMGGEPGVSTIPNSMGAATARTPEPEGLKSGPLVETLGKISPVARTLTQQRSPTARWMMAQLADAGLGMKSAQAGRVTALGGTAENRIKTWYSNYWRAAEVIDQQFAKLTFGDDVPSVAPNLRATLSGMLGTGKMSRMEFRKEIARAMFNGDEHAIEEVAAAAKFIRKNLWEPLYEDAVRVGIFNGNEKALGDPTHMLRMFNTRMVEARRTEFIDILARNYEQKLTDDFNQSRENFFEQERKVKEYVEDVRRPADEVVALRQQFLDQLEQLELRREDTEVPLDNTTIPLDEFEDVIRETRRQASQARRNGDAVRHKQLLKDAREMEAIGGDPLKELRAGRSELRRRLRNLTRAEVSLGERQAKKLAKIEALEEANISALRRVISKGQRVNAKLDRLSDAQLDKELSGLKDRFEKLAQQYDKGEERISKLAGEEEGTFRLLDEAAKQEDRAGKLSIVAEALEEAERIDRQAVRAAIDAALNEALEKMNGLLSRRALRAERLEKQAAKLDPKQVEEHIARKMEGIREREGSLSEHYRRIGADDLDLRAGVADFARFAREQAEETTNHILGTYLRLPTVDVMQGERGSEITRVLDIPTKEIWDFVEQDVETLIRAHLRTMAPDIEIMDKFRVTGAQSFDWRNIIRPVVDEENAAIRAVDSAVDKNGAPRSDEWKMKEKMKLADEFAAIRRDLEATISRLRHTWGIPSDPNAMTTRLARIMMNLNTLRLMGTVMISSFPDVGRPVMKYGLTRTFRDGWVPFITNFKNFKLSAREVKLAGAALDPVLHTRAAAVFDMLDDIGRHSKFERGLQWATDRMGIMGLFDYWTSGMKQMAGVIANAEILDDIRIVVEGGSAKEVRRATEALANRGIDGETAVGIWAEVTTGGGGGKVNGVWMPNTESWKDGNLVKAYRTALVREVDNAIVTPGVERPLWVNKTLIGRLASQFQSFAFSSTTKTVMAGLQERDARVAVGAMMSLAMGAFSYYIWALTVGGDALKEANKFDPAKYADEAITRSGLLGMGDIAQRILERIPATAPYATFSGQRTTRRGGDDLLGAAAGPSFDLLENAAAVLMGMDDPTEGTARSVKRLTPYQNIFYLRQLFEKIIDSSNLPESRR